MAIEQPKPRAFAWKPAIRAALEVAATLHDLPPALVRAVCYVESRGNPLAKSDAGAQGLMQLMPATAASLGVTDAFDPIENARAGARYLAMMLAQFGDLERALYAYNWGPGNMSKAIARGSAVPSSVQRYAADVLARMEVERSSDPFTQAVGKASDCFCCPRCGLRLAVIVGEAR